MTSISKLSQKFIYLLLLLVVYTEVNKLHALANREVICTETEGKFDKTEKGTVSDSDRKCITFTYNFTTDQDWASNLCVSSSRASQRFPILVVIRESIKVRSFQVPKVYSETELFQEVCYTICPLAIVDPAIKPGEEKIKVEISTYSTQEIDFQLNLRKLNDTILENQPLTFNITPSQPRVLEYKLNDNLNSVRVEAVSPDRSCMILALQEVKCPFYDNDGDIDQAAFYQTMTNQSAITITKQSFPKGRAFIILILKSSDSDCLNIGHETLTAYQRVKEVTVRVEPGLSNPEFYAAILSVAGLYGFVYILTMAICCFLGRNSQSVKTADVDPVISSIQISETPKTLENCSLHEDRPLQNGTNPSGSTDTVDSNRVQSISTVTENHLEGRSNPCDIHDIAEIDIDHLPDAYDDVDIIRSKPVLYVCDLSRKGRKYLKGKSKAYFWNLVAIAIFYGVPVIQLVFINQEIVNLTGNQDLCYYNFLCSNQFWIFSDFNHIYSNIGYVLLGILFMMLVRRRQSICYARENTRSFPKQKQEKLTGIPYHFDIMYAMGWALIMEGLLSASYHVCPNRTNFQFDTAFMYVIATICIVKLYFSRHSDIAARSLTTWMFLSTVVLLSLVGVFERGIFFWLVFSFIHVSVTVYVLSRVYYVGRIRYDSGIFGRIFQNIRLQRASNSYSPKYKGRFYLIASIGLLNIIADILGLVLQPSNFGTFLVIVFIANLLVYATYYTCMKLGSEEKISYITWLYIGLSFGLWIAAFYFFVQKRTKWQDTPAISRENNRHCLILNFYDDHDYWHMLSSLALFTSYMVLFTLDDDVENVPKAEIRVF